MKFTIKKNILNRDLIFRDGKNDEMERLCDLVDEYLDLDETDEDYETDEDSLCGEIYDMLDHKANPRYDELTNYLVFSVADLVPISPFDED